jgi:hypothetical protein
MKPPRRHCHLPRVVGAAAMLMAALACGQEAQPTISASLLADKGSLFQFETFSLTVVIDSAGVRLGKGLELLSLPDPASLQLGPFQELPTDRKVQTDQIREIRRYRCEGRAMQTGVLNLAPTIRATAIVQRRLLFGRQWVETPVDLPVQPLALTIRPLPAEGRPKQFSGAVGDLRFTVEPAPLNVAVGDLVTAVLKISGKGYFNTLVPPSFPAAPQFKVYELRPVPGGADEKVFEQILIPLSTNAVRIPAVSFCYFDPHAAAYKTLTQGPFSLRFHAQKAALEEDRYRPVIVQPTVGRKTPMSPRLAGLKALSFKDHTLQAFVDKANRAFTDGYYQAAIDSYQALATRTPPTAELLYNLGTASFLGGQPGSAVLNYRRCLRLNPRDGAARDNLAIVAASAGAATYADEWPGTWVTLFTPWGWMIVAVLIGGVGAILLAMRILIRKARLISGGLAAVAGVLLAIALYGAASTDRPMAEIAVVMHRDSARLAPADTALTSFECAEGSTVRVLERSGTWLKVELKGDRGWLPSAALTMVVSQPAANGPIR